MEEIKENKRQNIRILKHLSLFSGCGGMDLGFEGDFLTYKRSVPKDFISEEIDSTYVKVKKTRFKTVFANDILKDAHTAWINYFSKKGVPESTYHLESIVDLVKKHKSGETIFPDKIDIITGGFPCQDFSLSGKRKGFNSNKDHNGNFHNGDIISEETRGKLYFWMKEVIDITKPKIFIAENVKGLVNFENIRDIIQKDFSEANSNGYIVLPPIVLQAADFGVPQSRERVIFIGIKKSALKPEAYQELTKKNISHNYNPYPPSTHSYTFKDENLLPYVKLKEVLSPLQEPHLSDDISQRFYSKAKFMGTHCQGQKEIDLNGIAPTIRSEHHGNIEFRRLSKENGGTISHELQKGMPERRLTVRECAIIQTFPIDYDFILPDALNKKKFTLSSSGAYKIIGNAVPPLLAYNIAQRLEKLWHLYFN